MASEPPAHIAHQPVAAARGRSVRARVVVVGVLAVAGILVGAALLAHSLGGRTPEVTYLTAPAVVTDIVDTVSVTGSVAPVETYALAFGQAPVRNPPTSSAGAATGGSPGGGWAVRTVTARAGDAVGSGTVLATADTTDAQATLTTAQLNLAAAEARLEADAQPVTETARARATLAITQASQQLSQARAAQTQTATSGRLAVSQAEAVLAEARQRLADDRAASLPETAIAADTAAVSQAQRALATARQQAAVANAQATAAVQTAMLNVQSAQLAYQEATTVNRDAAIAADRVAVAQAQAAVRDAQTALDRLTLRAPIDGIVSSVTIGPGDVVSGTVIVLRSAALEVSAAATETDLPAIRSGQPAKVTLAALGASVGGTVAAVDLAGATKSAGGVVSYAITVSLAGEPSGAAPGMTADVDITTAMVRGVVAVPSTAVGGTPGAYTVQVYEGPGQVRTAPVEVGLMTAALAEIRSGISAGTTVVTGIATAKDLVTGLPAGPGATRAPAPSGPGQ